MDTLLVLGRVVTNDKPNLKDALSHRAFFSAMEWEQQMGLTGNWVIWSASAVLYPQIVLQPVYLFMYSTFLPCLQEKT